jgi:hypothetical protein
MVLIVCYINGAGRQAAPKQSNFRFSLDVHPPETLSSIKANISKYCDHPIALVTPLARSGRCAMTGGRLPGRETTQTSLTSVSHNSCVAHLGITDRRELVFGLFGQPLHPSVGAPSGKGFSKKSHHLDLSKLFSGDGSDGTADNFLRPYLMFLRHFHQKELVTKVTCHRQHLMLLDLCGTFSSQFSQTVELLIGCNLLHRRNPQVLKLRPM